MVMSSVRALERERDFHYVHSASKAYEDEIVILQIKSDMDAPEISQSSAVQRGWAARSAR